MSQLFDTPSTPPLRAVIQELRSGALLIPDFQRSFVWSDEQRLNLLDSIARGIPIGALLIWRTASDDGRLLETYEKVGPWPVGQRAPTPPWSFVIDGHQRLSTLYAALFVPVTEGQHCTGGQGDDWRVLVDLEAPPDSRIFVLPSRRLGERPTLVQTNVLLSNRLVYAHQQRLWDAGHPAEAERLEVLANTFKDYAVAIVPMASDDINVVTQAFARINTSGSPMSEANLASAIAYGKLDLRGRLQQVATTFAEQGWADVDESAVLDLHKLHFNMDVYKTEVEALLKEMGVKDDDATLLDGLLSDATVSLELATSLLSGVFVLGSQALPYRFQLLVLAEALWRGGHSRMELSEDQVAKLRARVETWFWQTTLTEHFRGATSSTVRNALAGLTPWLAGDGDGSPLQGESVRLLSSRRQWGSVTALSRVLAWLVRLSEDAPEAAHLAAVQLAQLGRGAVHKVRSDLDTKRHGAWVVADPEQLRELRAWLSGPTLFKPPLCVAQLTRQAQECLARDDTAGFLYHQDAALLDAERTMVVRHGLVLENPDQNSELAASRS